MKKTLLFIFVLILTVGGFIFLQNKNSGTAKPLSDAPAPTGQATPEPEIDPSSLTWTETKTNAEGWPKRDSHSVFTFDNKMWVLGGLDADSSKINGVPDYETAIYYNDIWNTSDGINWTRVVEHADFPYIRSASVVEFKGVLYMYGGWSPHDGLEYKNGIWSSTDGIHWKKVVDKPDYPEREGQIVLEWNGKLWLVGGVDYFGRKTFNDVWSSDDGIHWTAATTDAPWHSRWDHALGVWNGKMYIAGGMNFRGVGYSDEWSSSDGAHWDLVSANAAWGERQGQEIVNYHGYMWLISGLHSASNEGRGDAWYSTDGIEWKKAPDDYQWKGREDHGVIVFNDKIWVMGGMDSDWHWNGDVWSSNFKNKNGSNTNTGIVTPTPAPSSVESQTTTSLISAEEYLSVLVDPQGKQTILAEKNKSVPMPIASITKLMTATVSLENIDQNSILTIPTEILQMKGTGGNLQAGESFKASDLLYSLLVGSDNDSARLLASTKGETNFAALMSQKAQEIGMTHTHYINATGVDPDGDIVANVSTAEDLAVLASYIKTNHPEIFSITQLQNKTILSIGGVAHSFTTTDKFLGTQTGFTILGGKTGETPSAKKNLLLIIEAPNKKGFIISVILHSDDNFKDMATLIHSVENSHTWN
ncbi:MAG: serine hydrolase [Candidatus Pacebacteria bacterium]|nr:serine hydrolase [Candidatus Paceibacterota bacterium]